MEYMFTSSDLPHPANRRLAGLSTARAAAESLDCCFRRNDTSTPAFG